MVSMLISNEGPVSNVVFSVILSCKLTMFIDIWIFQGRSSDTRTHPLDPRMKMNVQAFLICFDFECNQP